MGIMLVYDITNQKTFDNISKWLRNIDEVSSLIKIVVDGNDILVLLPEICKYLG